MSTKDGFPRWVLGACRAENFRMGYPLSRFITRGENKPYLISRLRKRVDQALIPISTIQKFQLCTLNIVGRNEMLLLLLSPLSHHLSNNVD